MLNGPMVHLPNKKRPSHLVRRPDILGLTYNQILKCANALLASAILWVSSFFLKAPPSPLLAATISLASLSAMERPLRSREKRMSHLMEREIFLSGRTSEGIWKVAPPIRRLLTSTAGETLDNAFLQTSYPSSLVILATLSSAS